MDFSLIKDSMLEVWNSSDKTTELIFSTDYKLKFAGYYQPTIHRITIFLYSIPSIYQGNDKFNTQMSLEEFCKIVIAHELSHSMDPLLKEYVAEDTRIKKEIQIGIEEKDQNKIDYNDTLFQKNTVFFETRAWILTRRNFSQYFKKESLYIVMRSNLGSHFKLYKKSLGKVYLKNVI